MKRKENEFTIVDIDEKAYKLKADGFDYIWVDKNSIEKNITTFTIKNK